ncbi:M4 family metallopeptidase [Streptomyces sp. NPDC059637]|uniref:M4 family metallopeptidase n=1 Tax=Streptomyces sp. NPDC059637 TaxID=3347752 RepID=UPI003678E3AD
METTRLPFCTIVPPHITERLARSDDPRLREAARRTAGTDVLQRNARIAAQRARILPRAVERPPTPRPRRTVYDAGHRQALPGRRARAEGEGAVADASVNRAYDGLGATFSLYLEEFDRYSIDGGGLPLDATVHFGRGYDNAFWDGSRMVFGDGDGEVFKDFTLSLDVIGHELTHGVVQYTAALEYHGQSGALNESMADVFGSLVKQYALDQTAADADWLIGADLLTDRVRGRALRDMRAPGTAYDDDVLGKDPQPATMDDYVETRSDNGGVHINSGIPNRAFHLVAAELGGYAWERAGQIWYDVLAGGRLRPDAGFADFAALTVRTARERFSGDGPEAQAVSKAWAQVGVVTEG